MATPPRISIPQPCAQPWAAMTPTAAGRHCGACATEVVDFTRLSDAEIMAYLVRQGGRPVCALARAPQLAASVPASRWRRWALAGLALLGWQPLTSCATKPPQQLPAQATATTAESAPAQSQPLIIRGQVFDGESKTAAQVSIFIDGTQYGTVTDEQGRFELRMARDWAPLANGAVALRFVGNPFDFKEQTLSLNTRTTPQPGPLMVRMESVPRRGQVMGKIRMPEPPVAPPQK